MRHGTRNWGLLQRSRELPLRDNKACCNRFILLKKRFLEQQRLQTATDATTNTNTTAANTITTAANTNSTAAAPATESATPGNDARASVGSKRVSNAAASSSAPKRSPSSASLAAADASAAAAAATTSAAAAADAAILSERVQSLQKKEEQQEKEEEEEKPDLQVWSATSPNQKPDLVPSSHLSASAPPSPAAGPVVPAASEPVLPRSVASEPASPILPRAYSVGGATSVLVSGQSLLDKSLIEKKVLEQQPELLIDTSPLNQSILSVQLAELFHLDLAAAATGGEATAYNTATNTTDATEAAAAAAAAATDGATAGAATAGACEGSGVGMVVDRKRKEAPTDMGQPGESVVKRLVRDGDGRGGVGGGRGEGGEVGGSGDGVTGALLSTWNELGACEEGRGGEGKGNSAIECANMGFSVGKEDGTGGGVTGVTKSNGEGSGGGVTERNEEDGGSGGVTNTNGEGGSGGGVTIGDMFKTLLHANAQHVAAAILDWKDRVCGSDDRHVPNLAAAVKLRDVGPVGSVQRGLVQHGSVQRGSQWQQTRGPFYPLSRPSSSFRAPPPLLPSLPLTSSHPSSNHTLQNQTLHNHTPYSHALFSHFPPIGSPKPSSPAIGSPAVGSCGPPPISSPSAAAATSASQSAATTSASQSAAATSAPVSTAAAARDTQEADELYIEEEGGERGARREEQVKGGGEKGTAHGGVSVGQPQEQGEFEVGKHGPARDGGRGQVRDPDEGVMVGVVGGMVGGHHTSPLPPSALLGVSEDDVISLLVADWAAEDADLAMRAELAAADVEPPLPLPPASHGGVRGMQPQESGRMAQSGMLNSNRPATATTSTDPAPPASLSILPATDLTPLPAGQNLTAPHTIAHNGPYEWSAYIRPALSAPGHVRLPRVHSTGPETATSGCDAATSHHGMMTGYHQYATSHLGRDSRNFRGAGAAGGLGETEEQMTNLVEGSMLWGMAGQLADTMPAAAAAAGAATTHTPHACPVHGAAVAAAHTLGSSPYMHTPQLSGPAPSAPTMYALLRSHSPTLAHCW
ncbi:unnamed protein product [Closterium sp. NIES-65]|nr:unnamed protein product [Closterium sp. NIES-65]